MKTKILIYALLASLFLGACSDINDLVPPSQYYEDEVFTDVTRAQEFINPAYGGVPRTPPIGLEYYTDNAVHKSAARLYITAENSPVSSYWSTAMRWQLHINEFFEKADTITYSLSDPTLADNRKKRIVGEAYGLRAYYKWSLLKNFAGPSEEDSTMLGFPIIDDVLVEDSVNYIPRATYMECYTSIMSDIDTALVLMQDFKKRYGGNGDVDGSLYVSRICGEMLAALKARVALYAASPAYAQISWEAAADTIYNAIEYTGGLLDLRPYGEFNMVDDNDHFWRVSFSQSGSLEAANFPPSLLGNGECNPTQNLIDAFGGTYGYPFGHDFTYMNDYVNDPYGLENKDRDPRFYHFIFYNGMNEFKGTEIQTYEGGNDLAGVYSKIGTKTSYYMKKFLSPNIEFDEAKGKKTSDYKVYPIFTRTGLFLDFAEAAANAYGIEGKGAGMAYSALEAITKVRTRIGTPLTDYYMDDEVVALGDLAAFKTLVANERRIEMAFEGERFYDVRRLKLPLDYLNQDLRGMYIKKADDGTLSYNDTIIDQQYFEKHMYYNPIPRSEVLRSEAIVQNAGW